jgi:hypothetical protein
LIRRQAQRVCVFQVSVLVAEPGEVLLRDAEHRARGLLFRAPDDRKPLARHLLILGALVVVRVNDDPHGVPVLRQQFHRAAAHERVVIGMRREHKHVLAGPVFDPVFIRDFDRYHRSHHRLIRMGHQ